MGDNSDKYFFAGYRGYYTNGTTFLQIIGLGYINNQSYHVRERELSKRGIKLGDFLSATVPMGKPVENFHKMEYKFKVKVDENFATIEDQEADLEKTKDGILVFRTKTFGSVRSVSQSIPLGKYKITIRPTKIDEEHLFNDMKYCAEVKEAVNSSGSSSTSSNVIVGSGFSTEGVKARNKQDMRAFVYSLIKKGEQTTYFLWICDNHQKSIFTSKTHNLAIGHFFNGIFEETPSEKSKWQCVKYMKPINALMEGSIIGNRIELKTSIDRYEPGDGVRKRFPQVHSEFLGKIIDNKEKLPRHCNGRHIKTQLCKVNDDFRWVVTEVL